MDAASGRFLSEDPVWGENLYPYAENNPVINIDPRGLYNEPMYGAGNVVETPKSNAKAPPKRIYNDPYSEEVFKKSLWNTIGDFTYTQSIIDYSNGKDITDENYIMETLTSSISDELIGEIGATLGMVVIPNLAVTFFTNVLEQIIEDIESIEDPRQRIKAYKWFIYNMTNNRAMQSLDYNLSGY